MISVLCFFGVIIIGLMTALMFSFFAKEKLHVLRGEDQMMIASLRRSLRGANERLESQSKTIRQLRAMISSAEIIKDEKSENIENISKFEIGEP